MKSSTPVSVILIIAAIYFVSGMLGLVLAIPGTNVTPVWPPSGIALAAVLLLGYRTLWSAFLGSFILNVISISKLMVAGIGLTILASFITAIGAMLQAALGAYLIQEYIQTRPHFSRMSSVIQFLIFAMISCFVNSNFGTLAIAATGIIPWNSYLPVWWTWWVGDAAGIFIFTPLVFAWVLHPLQHWTKAKVIEALCLVALIFITAMLNLLPNTFLTYLYLPWLVWAAIRFQLPGATLALFFTVLAILLQTINGYGPFVKPSTTHSLITLELFIMATSATILILSAKLSRRTASSFVRHGSSDTISNLIEEIKEYFSNLNQRS